MLNVSVEPRITPGRPRIFSGAASTLMRSPRSSLDDSLSRPKTGIPRISSTSSATVASKMKERAPLGEMSDNISISSIPRLAKLKSTKSAQKPMVVERRISTRPPVSLVTLHNPIAATSERTTHLPSLSSPPLRLSGDETQLLDLSLAGLGDMSSTDEGDEDPNAMRRGIIRTGHLITPANSQDTVISAKNIELHSRPKDFAAERAIMGLETPPPSQSSATSTPPRPSASKRRTRPSQTPPKSQISSQSNPLSPTKLTGPSPNPRRKKSPRVEQSGRLLNTSSSTTEINIEEAPAISTPKVRPRKSTTTKRKSSLLATSSSHAEPPTASISNSQESASSTISTKSTPSTVRRPRKSGSRSSTPQTAKGKTGDKVIATPRSRRSSTGLSNSQPKSYASLTPAGKKILVKGPSSIRKCPIKPTPGQDPLLLDGWEADTVRLIRPMNSQVARLREEEGVSSGAISGSSVSFDDGNDGPSPSQSPTHHTLHGSTSTIASPGLPHISKHPLNDLSASLARFVDGLDDPLADESAAYDEMDEGFASESEAGYNEAEDTFYDMKNRRNVVQENLNEDASPRLPTPGDEPESIMEDDIFSSRQSVADDPESDMEQGPFANDTTILDLTQDESLQDEPSIHDLTSCVDDSTSDLSRGEYIPDEAGNPGLQDALSDTHTSQDTGNESIPSTGGDISVDESQEDVEDDVQDPVGVCVSTLGHLSGVIPTLERATSPEVDIPVLESTTPLQSPKMHRFSRFLSPTPTVPSGHIETLSSMVAGHTLPLTSKVVTATAETILASYAQVVEVSEAVDIPNSIQELEVIDATADQNDSLDANERDSDGEEDHFEHNDGEDRTEHEEESDSLPYQEDNSCLEELEAEEEEVLLDNHSVESEIQDEQTRLDASPSEEASIDGETRLEITSEEDEAEEEEILLNSHSVDNDMKDEQTLPHPIPAEEVSIEEHTRPEIASEEDNSQEDDVTEGESYNGVDLQDSARKAASPDDDTEEDHDELDEADETGDITLDALSEDWNLSGEQAQVSHDEREDNDGTGTEEDEALDVPSGVLQSAGKHVETEGLLAITEPRNTPAVPTISSAIETRHAAAPDNAQRMDAESAVEDAALSTKYQSTSSVASQAQNPFPNPDDTSANTGDALQPTPPCTESHSSLDRNRKIVLKLIPRGSVKVESEPEKQTAETASPIGETAGPSRNSTDRAVEDAGQSAITAATARDPAPVANTKIPVPAAGDSNAPTAWSRNLSKVPSRLSQHWSANSPPRVGAPSTSIVNEIPTSPVTSKNDLHMHEEDGGNESIRITNARPTLRDELEGADANTSIDSVVEISSLDPRAAARAAAILKMNHAYVEHGVLPSDTQIVRTPAHVRRKSTHGTQQISKQELLYEAEVELLSSQNRRSRSMSVASNFTAVTSYTSVTELPIPGGWIRTPKRKRQSHKAEHSTTSNHGSVLQHAANGHDWTVKDWRRLEKVYIAERESWKKEREIKTAPSVVGNWTKRPPVAGTPKQVAVWSSQRVVDRFVQDNAKEGGGVWDKQDIALRVKVLRRRIAEKTGDQDLEASSSDEDGPVPKRLKADSTATPGKAVSPKLSTAAPSSIKKVFDFVFYPWSTRKSTSLAAGNPFQDTVQSHVLASGKDANGPSRPISEAAHQGTTSHNALMKQVSKSANRRVAAKAPTLPHFDSPSEGASTNPLPASVPTVPPNPADIEEDVQSSAFLVESNTSRIDAWKRQVHAAPRPSIAPSLMRDLGSSVASTSAHSILDTPTGRLYPALYPPISQRSNAIKALFPDIHPLGESTSSDLSIGSAGSSSSPRSQPINIPRKSSGSVKDLVRSFEESKVIHGAMDKRAGDLRRSHSQSSLKRS